MPWSETSRVVERMKFIIAVMESESSFKAICEDFNISRETGYKWKRRFEAGGPEALVDRPPIAQNHPFATAVEIEDALIELRKLYPKWGPKKLKASLSRTRPELALPALSTIGRILNRRGQIRPRRRRVLVPPSTSGLSVPMHPNALWTTDHKGDFELADGRCYPLTLRDAFSRYLLRCEVSQSTKTSEARAHFESAFREFGLPEKIRSDNGPPFATCALGGLSRLSVWWVKLGIEIERIQPGHPEQNGGHERMHRTLKAEAVGSTDCGYAEQQRRFDHFRRYFNHLRPHEGIDLELPADRYETSWRPYPTKLTSPEYDSDMVVQRIYGNGVANWRGHRFHVSGLLKEEPVGIREVGDDRWTLHFGTVVLAGLELCNGKLEVERDIAAFMARLD